MQGASPYVALTRRSPGTRRVKWFEQNVAALDVTLPPGELFVLGPMASQVTGARY